jgi:DNA polymerase-2
MAEHRGWLLDLYADETDGLVLWLLDEDGSRRRLCQDFPITFYAHGPFPRLRALWRFLQNQPIGVQLARVVQEDLFAGLLDVLAVEVANPAMQPRLFRQVVRRFPDLTYYDADIPLGLRYAAVFDIFPLCHCEVEVDENGRIQTITPLESRWDVAPSQPPLRVLTIEPDEDPAHRNPTFLWIDDGRSRRRFHLQPIRLLLASLNATIKRVDPDVILTHFGDTWLLPLLLKAANELGADWFNLNRDETCLVIHRQENSYFTYGQVVYRGQQVHLHGRYHIDQCNAMMYGEYGLHGAFEQARVTGLLVQEIARKSPGSGVTALQMQEALRRGILVPFQKQQAEGFKTAAQLIRADRGGLVYQPTIGLHEDVVEIDFVSMYPSIMVRFNVSPETVGIENETSEFVPELDVPVDLSRVGLVPRTLRPLLVKRIAIKEQLATLTPLDCRYPALKARAAALKWLLVVCFGYLGYKNARFGRIESHEAVTAYGRECLLRAKEAAEDLGYEVLHMYVDGLWVKKPGVKKNEQVRPLLDEITLRTGLPIALEGIYKWVTFLPSRLDERVPVANRYFGVFQSGEIKTRDIEVRRHDTPPWIAQVQLEMIKRLAKVPDGRCLTTAVPDLITFLRQQVDELKNGRIPLENLLVSQRLSREIAEYRVPSPACRAAMQLAASGKPRQPGQRIRFWFVRGEMVVHAWDLPTSVETAVLDTDRYTTLLLRAASAILQPLDVSEAELRQAVLAEARQLPFSFHQGNRFAFGIKWYSAVKKRTRQGSGR